MAKNDTTVSTVWSLITILSLIALISILMECARGPCTMLGLLGPRGKYRFSTVHKVVSPSAKCKGYLELDTKARPIAIAFELGPDGQRATKFEFGIAQNCILEKRSGATVYPNLTQIDENTTLSTASLRFLEDKKMFMLTLTPAPVPWNIGLDHLSINIRTQDWPVLPPVKVCHTKV